MFGSHDEVVCAHIGRVLVQSHADDWARWKSVLWIWLGSFAASLCVISRAVATLVFCFWRVGGLLLLLAFHLYRIVLRDFEVGVFAELGGREELDGTEMRIQERDQSVDLCRCICVL